MLGDEPVGMLSDRAGLGGVLAVDDRLADAVPVELGDEEGDRIVELASSHLGNVF